MNTQTVDLGFRPRPWQDKAFRDRKRFNVEVVHRRGGKTVKAVIQLVDAALKSTATLPRFGYVAPFLGQAKSIAWDMLKTHARKIPGCVINAAELYIELPHNNARVRIFGADNPDTLRGLYFDGIVMDEVADLKPEVWTAIILPALLDRGGWATFIGTPKGVNLFSEMYYHAVNDPEWNAVLHTVYETGALSEADIEIARAAMPDAIFRQEMLCDFTAAAVDSLIAVDTVQAASGKHIGIADYQFAAKVIGVDVARQGDDRTVIFKRQGLASFTPTILRKSDSMAVAGVVAAQIAEWKPDAVMVDGSGGYGAGVIDRLKQLGHNPTEVQFGGSADDARYSNKRTEMYARLAEWLLRGGALPADEALKIELCAHTVNHKNAAGKMALESKDEIKRRLGFSPDLADAIALTFAFDVQPATSATYPLANQNTRAVVDRPDGERY